jgi:hypothetical protein
MLIPIQSKPGFKKHSCELMLPSRSHWQHHHVTLCMLLVLSLISAVKARSATDELSQENIIHFKNYLSTPICIERLIYAEQDGCSANVKENVYQRNALAFYDGEFFIRNIRDGEKLDLIIDRTNKMMGSFFIGKSKDFSGMSWQINGFTILKSISPKTNDPKSLDPITVTSKQFQRIVNGIVNLGSQNVVPGSFVWQGNEFEAARFGVSAEFPNPTKRGRIICSAGKVTDMYLTGGEHFIYEYEQNSNRPDWFPTKLTVLKNEKCTKVFVFDRVKLGQKENMASKFNPDTYLPTQLQALTVISNGQVVSESIEGKPISPRHKMDFSNGSNQTVKLVFRCIFLLLILCPICFILGRLFFKRNH